MDMPQSHGKPLVRQHLTPSSLQTLHTPTLCPPYEPASSSGENWKQLDGRPLILSPPKPRPPSPALPAIPLLPSQKGLALGLALSHLLEGNTHAATPLLLYCRLSPGGHLPPGNKHAPLSMFAKTLPRPPAPLATTFLCSLH